MISAGWKWIERGTDLLWPASLELVFAATLLLLIAAVMHLGLRRAAASLRHRVWALTMGGLLLVPLLCPILPKLPLPLSIPLAENRPEAAKGTVPIFVSAKMGLSPLPPRAEPSSDSVAFPAAQRAGPLPQPTSVLPVDVPAAAADPRPAGAPTAKTSIGSGRSLLAKTHCALILVCALGTVLYLLAMARRLWLERHMAKSASELDDPSWQTLLEELKLQFGIRWAVAISVSQESEVPLAVGWRRPRILLPVDYTCWPAEKRRVVLAHELSHVARHDVFWQVVARLACAVYWFHPLAWLAERRMRVERELACDDAVLRSGSQPGEYAAVLLDVAAAVSRRPHARAAAIAMACRHPIQRRIRAILQPGLNRLPVGPRTGRLSLAAALLLVVLAAGLHPFAPPQVQADPAKSPEAAAANSEQHVGKQNEASKPPVAAANAKVAGKVIDESGKPLAGADIWLPVWFYGIGTVQTLYAKSDVQGRFVVEISAALLAKMHWWERDVTVWAYAHGRQVKAERAVLPSGAADVVLRLAPAADTSFVVLDPQGRPCAGALVEPFLVKTSLAFEYQHLPEELMARVAARTDKEGRVKLPAASLHTLSEVRITTKEFGIQVQRVGKSQPPAIIGNTIRLRPAGKIEGLLIASQPEAARDVRLVFTTEDRSGNSPRRERRAEGFAEVKSDKDGRFVVPALAEGELRIDARVNENQPLRPRLPERVRLGSGATTSLAIPLVPTVLARGSVREKGTGKPLPGALLSVSYGVGGQYADAVTDAQGNYTARVLSGPIGLQLICPPEEYVPMDAPLNRAIEVPMDAKEFDLPPVELVPAKRIEGRLIDEHDRPVSNAGIFVIEGNRRYGYGKSDSSGRFSVEGVPPTIDPTKVEYQWYAPDDRLPRKCEVVKTNPLILRALPRDTRAIDIAAGKTLTVGLGKPDDESKPPAGAPSGKAGGYARLGQAAPASPAAAASAKVSGKVIDENGKPVAGADVWLPVRLDGIGIAQTLRTKSDDQGRFVLEISAPLFAKIKPWDPWLTVWAYARGRALGTAPASLPNGASKVVIRLGPATDTSFVVLDPGGQPCAGALVEIDFVRTPMGFARLPDELMASVAARTDAKGRVNLPAASPDTLSEVCITAKDYGIQIQQIQLVEYRQPPAIIGYTIRLRPVGKIEGRVISSRREAARGVRLIFSAAPGSFAGDTDVYRSANPPQEPTEGFADVKSDKDGRFVVPALAAGLLHVDVLVNQNQPLRPKLPGIIDLSPGKTASLEIPMVPTVVVLGAVRWKDTGKPIPGAPVYISYGVGQGASAVTDAQGNYTARVLPGRVAVQMLFKREEYVQYGAPWKRDIEVPQDAKTFDLPPAELVPARRIEGRLVDVYDRPISNAQIYLSDGNRSFGYGDNSDSGGKFTLLGVPKTIDPAKAEYKWSGSDGVPHKCEVLKTNPLVLRAAGKHGAATSTKPGTPDGASKPPADVPRTDGAAKARVDAAPAKVAGKVIDENGKPVAGADVWLRPVIVYKDMAPTLHTKADDQGRFVLEISADLRAKMKPWDWIEVWAYASGRRFNAAPPILPNGASDVVIRLGPATDTSFVVLDPKGRPCAGALVEPSSLRTKDPPFGFSALLPEELKARVAARTDAAGRVKLPAASSDTLDKVRITAKDFGIQDQRVEKGDLSSIVGNTIHLRPVSKIEGRVISSRPEAARDVRIAFITYDNSANSPWPTEGYSEVKSDKDGRFVVPALAAGDMRIYVRVNEKQPLLPKLPQTIQLPAGHYVPGTVGPATQEPKQTIHLPAGETVSLEIQMVAAVLVRGVVRAKDTGKPMPGVRVHISYDAGRQWVDVFTDALGRYTARVLPGRIEGQMTSAAEDYAQYPWNREIEVPQDAKVFDLPAVELVPARRIEGRLVDEHDRPVANAGIFMNEENRHFALGRSDRSGKFTLTGVPTAIDPAKAEYEWFGPDEDPHECEVLKTNPLILRALPRDPLSDKP